MKQIYSKSLNPLSSVSAEDCTCDVVRIIKRIRINPVEDLHAFDGRFNVIGFILTNLE